MSINNVHHIKVFPGIGMARVGNSPEHFIGPESFGEVPNPGHHKYKDAQGRIKRQAARFRVYGYDAEDKMVMEITQDLEGITLTWEVDVVNKKAEHFAFQGKYAFDPSVKRNPGVVDPMKRKNGLIIDPGPQSISGISQTQGNGAKDLIGNIFDGIGHAEIPTSLITPGVAGNTRVKYNSQSVNLGRLETDNQGRLVFIGGAGDAGCLTEPPTIIAKGVGTIDGETNINPNSNGNSYFNNPGWYDDTCGGAINATVSYEPTGGGSPRTFSTRPNTTTHPWGDPLKRGWIGVGPPKYVPQMNNVVSLLDLQINMFPEIDPYGGTFNFIAVNGSQELEISTKKKPVLTGLDFSTISGITTPVVGAPSAVAFAGKFYIAYTNGTDNYLATSSDGTTFTSSKIGSQATNVGPALTAFNGNLIYVVTGTDNHLYLSTSADGMIFSSFTQIQAQSGTNSVPSTSVSSSLAAYNGYLYLAVTGTDNHHYLATQPQGSNEATFVFSTIGGSVEGSELSPSIHYFDGDLYYAFTGINAGCYLAKWNNFAVLNNYQSPSLPGPNASFDFSFELLEDYSSTAGPCITSYNGKFYYAIRGFNGFAHLAAGKAGFSFESLTFTQTGDQIAAEAPAIAAFETVSFYRDIYPILRTVTDYAWVNMPAFSGHSPNKNGDFLKNLITVNEHHQKVENNTGIALPDYANNLGRLRIFQAIRRPGQMTPNLPPPPVSAIALGQTYVADREPRGSLMPHLVGDGGSRDENLFNDTNFPNQWLSLTRHQLAKFQHWVNGSFVSQADAVTLSPQKSLNFSALEPTVGGGFHPGIELTYYMELQEYFAAPFRFTDQIRYTPTGGSEMSFPFEPGIVSGYMSVPWHGDFWSCSGDFWAAQRPDIVVTAQPGPVGGYEFFTDDWFRGTGVGIPENADSLPDYLNLDNQYGNTGYEAMAQYWTQFGFVLKTGKVIAGQDEMKEFERADCLDSSSSPCIPAFPTPPWTPAPESP